MSILIAFENLSLTPFCSEQTKKEFARILPNEQSKNSFLNGDQHSLRESLSLNDGVKFADAIDVVAF
ncbi:TPA: hypothetical protein KKX58_003093 [Legionella pneumophila]|nr:hypothetical protein [Legionella pneumophila]HBD7411739.1 hypothetical protein [Legionella pneumophila]HBD9406926.1 hypothetical protein [Legionella pneumophila]HBI2969973.1 hypothetical protein [Legionella pneumophila]